MPKIELEQITARYEFEDRAAFFIAAVNKLAERYRSSHIEVENITTERLEDLQKAIKSSRDPDLVKKLATLEYDFEVESANKNGVIVMIYCHTSKPIGEFERKVDALAKNFRGVKNKDDTEVFDFEDDPGEDFRFVASFTYDFSNDFKN